MLEVEIPVHDVRTLGIGINKTVSDLLFVEVDVLVDAGAQRRPWCGSNDLEGSGCRRIQTEFIGKGQHVKHPKPGTHYRLSILPRVPFQPDAGLEVLVGWILQKRAVYTDRSARRRARQAVRQADDFLEPGCGHAVAVDRIAG